MRSKGEHKRFPKATLTIIIVAFVFLLWQLPLLAIMGENIRSLTFGAGNVGLVGLFTSIFLHAAVPHRS